MLLIFQGEASPYRLVEGTEWRLYRPCRFPQGSRTSPPDECLTEKNKRRNGCFSVPVTQGLCLCEKVAEVKVWMFQEIQELFRKRLPLVRSLSEAAGFHSTPTRPPVFTG